MQRILSRLRPPLRSTSNALLIFSPPSCRRSPIPENLPPPWASPFSSSRKRKGADEEREVGKDDDGAVPGVFLFGSDPQSPPKMFVVQPRLRPDSVLHSKLSEALNLAKSLEEQRDGLFQGEVSSKKIPSHLVVQNPSARSTKSHAENNKHCSAFFTFDVVEGLYAHLRTLGQIFRDIVHEIFDGAGSSGKKQRNLSSSLEEREPQRRTEAISWGKPVLDRIGLIIEIFNSHAETKEAKLQSELAALMYKRSRLVRVRGPHGRLTFGTSGEAEVVSGRGKGSGGRGSMSGAGETELQLQRRRIQERKNQLLLRIEEVRRTRALQRSSRKRHGSSDGHSLATVAVVGYTNAVCSTPGKSTLVSALSNSNLYRDDRLFATVDPRLRSVFLPSGRKALLSDTVGFISDLPVQLVEAFHATLEEVVEADLLLHVLDSSAPNVDEQRSSVLEVLLKIGVSEEKIQNMIEVWNKIDLLNKHGETMLEGEEQRNGELTEDADEKHELEEAGEDGVPSKIQVSMCSEQTVYVDLRNSIQISAFPEAASRVETSAITGIGLKELLSLVSEKLAAQKLVDKTSVEVDPFDRKWRQPHEIVFSGIALEQ
ncbi:GTP-binding protein [Platanthera guangdongensis]|uniref:GTP-binding protein n=1 Tax=Platanthera guangdongensis TaxID=2320717 RepID=A0ABR2N1I7_9ASPA